MTITFVMRAEADGDLSFDSTGAVALVAVCRSFASAETMVDGRGNTWTRRTFTEIGTYRHAIFDCLAPTSLGAGHTLAGSLAGVSQGSIVLYRLTGASAFTYDVSSASNDGTFSASSCQPGSITPTANNAHIFTGAFIGNFNGSSPTIDSGFPEDYADIAEVNGAIIQTTAAAINPTISFGATSRWAASIAAYLPASSPSATANLVGGKLTGSMLLNSLAR